VVGVFIHAHTGVDWTLVQATLLPPTLLALLLEQLTLLRIHSLIYSPSMVRENPSSEKSIVSFFVFNFFHRDFHRPQEVFHIREFTHTLLFLWNSNNIINQHSITTFSYC
jgi:hypothetical protein